MRVCKRENLEEKTILFHVKSVSTGQVDNTKKEKSFGVRSESESCFGRLNFGLSTKATIYVCCVSFEFD
jgi:hypothetical protein